MTDQSMHAMSQSQASRKTIKRADRAAELMRREFWRRCRKLGSSSVAEEDYAVHDGGTTIYIQRRPGVRPNSDPIYFVSVRAAGSYVMQVASNDCYSLDSERLTKFVKVALPILRAHMVLDDLAEA